MHVPTTDLRHRAVTVVLFTFGTGLFFDLMVTRLPYTF